MTLAGRRRTHGALALAGIAALTLAACGSSKSSTGNAGNATPTTSAKSSSGSTQTLKVGFFGALTGPDAQLGINIKNGAQLAVTQYDASNPPVKVELDPFDSQGNPAQANNGAQKMINDKVVAVIGPAFSGESATADPIFETAQIPSVSASATAVKLAQNGWKYFHRVVAADDAQGPGDADYLVKVLKDTKVAAIDDSSTYGEGLANAVRSQVSADGASVVLSDHINPNGQDYGASVNKVIAAHADAVFFGGYYDAAGRLVNQLRAAGYTGTFMSGDGSEDQRFVSDAGGAPAEGSYLSCPCADTTSSTNPAAQAFVSAYRAAFGTPPEIYSAEAYDAAGVVLAAIKAGNTTGPTINSWLASNSYQGITKTIKFQPDGNIVGSTIYIYKVENGKIVQIATTS